MIEPQDVIPEALRHELPSALIHDLRTPLNQIIGYSEMLMEEERGEEDFVPDLRKIQGAGKRLLTLINEHFRPARGLDTPAALAAPREEQPSPFEQESADRAPGVGAARGSLLVVDDIADNRHVLSRRLERQGYAVATAENGREALERLRAAAFDLVLLDIMMPEMDGYEVLRRLKADPALSHIPVIMISALSELDSVVRCIELGADDYLPKPFDPTLLKARIGASLEKKHARDRETQLFAQLGDNYRRLQELEKLRDDLTHMIVHDLRTPLNAMIMGLSAVEASGELNEAQGEMLAITRRGGKTLVEMINDLLEISKMESGSLPLEAGEIAAGELVDAAIQQVATLASAQGLILRAVLEPGLPPIMADRGKLLRTLVNLLGNALKFTPAGGSVTVAGRRDPDGRSLVFAVRDTGEGIPVEAFERIFEKFGQVETRLGGRTMSTGLGLAFCKLVVEAHHGRLWVESAPGEGSTFSFTIPLPPASGP